MPIRYLVYRNIWIPHNWISLITRQLQVETKLSFTSSAWARQKIETCPSRHQRFSLPKWINLSRMLIPVAGGLQCLRLELCTLNCHFLSHKLDLVATDIFADVLVNSEIFNEKRKVFPNMSWVAAYAKETINNFCSMCEQPKGNEI